jgi:hypothetical protein
MERRITDTDLARRFAAGGLSGFVVKSHYVPTAERAAVVRAACPGADVIGAITLNAAVGGINPPAVEVAAREGARIVWLPTVDARNQRQSAARDPLGARPPMWARLQQDLATDGLASGAVLVVDADGRLLPEVRAVLRVIARHDLVLATGHLGRDETFAVVDGAAEAGIRHVVVTHPEFTCQRLQVADQCELAARGALLERCFTTPYTGKVTWQRVFQVVRETGIGSSFWSSDLGQPFNPPVEDGLALMADAFLGAGFTEDEVHTMAVANTVRLATGVTGPSRGGGVRGEDAARARAGTEVSRGSG